MSVKNCIIFVISMMKCFWNMNNVLTNTNYHLSVVCLPRPLQDVYELLIIIIDRCNNLYKCHLAGI